MNNTKLLLCEEAFNRLKAGKPNNPKHKDMPITASLVSKEAGFTAGYLKSKNKHHQSLIEDINSFQEKSDDKILSPDIIKLESRLKKEKELAAKYKQQLDAALEREFNLYIQVNELVQKSAIYKNITALE